MNRCEKHHIYPKYQQYFVPKKKLEAVFNEMLTEITGVDLKAEIYYDEETFKATLMMDEEHLGSRPLKEYERLVENQYYGFHPDSDYENFSKLSIMLFDTSNVKGGLVGKMSDNEASMQRKIRCS